MKKRLMLVAALAIMIAGARSAIAADSPDFTSRKTIVDNLISQNYTGPEDIKLNASEQEVKDSWLPYANALLEKDKTLSGTNISNAELNSDGSVKIYVNLGPGVKKLIKLSFFSSAAVTFKPSAENGQLKVQITKLKVGFLPISPSIAQRLLSRWGINVNNFVVKVKNINFDSIVVSDKDISVNAKYLGAGVKASYACSGGKTIKAFFYKGKSNPTKPGEMPKPSGTVSLTLDDGRALQLPQTISADGGRYANNDESLIFWDKGGTARFLEQGKEKGYTNCKRSK